MAFKEIDVELMRSLFCYKDGMLFNTVFRGARSIKGARAGFQRWDGYRDINVMKSLYREHRIIYAMHHGGIPTDMDIDHINGDRGDNRVENLRLATRKQNVMCRKSTNKNNILGVRGVSASKGSFRSFIDVDGKQTHLGTFRTIEEASAAYEAARELYFGEFA